MIKSPFTFYPLLLFLLISNSESKELSKILSNSIYDSIAISIELVYYGQNKIEGLSNGTAFTKIESNINKDNSIFWKTLLANNVIKYNETDTGSLQFECGCGVFVYVYLFGNNLSAKLKLDACDIKRNQGKLFIGSSLYYLDFDKKISKSLKDYIKNLIETAMPRDFKDWCIE
jgi:hypothetical protein